MKKYSILLLLGLLPLVMQADNRHKTTKQAGMNLMIPDLQKSMRSSVLQPDKLEKQEKSSLLEEGENFRGQNIMAKRFPDKEKMRGYKPELYANVVRQSGFWKGVGRQLTQKEASHLGCHFCLWRASLAEPYVYMQALDSRGRLTSGHGIMPYLASIDEQGLDEAWQQKLMSICQWEVVRDGKTVKEENAFDSDGNIIYTYIPTSVDENFIVGHYVDLSGMMAVFHKDKSDAPQYVQIIQDTNGYEKNIALTDANGYPCKNVFDAYKSIREYDKEGNVICDMSHDAMGQPVIDNCGNCGWRAQYNERGWITHVTNIDTERNPIRIKASPQVIAKRYHYDVWGNMTGQDYLDAKDSADVDALTGRHCYRWTYDDHGNRISSRSMRKDSTLVNDTTGVARWERRFDSEDNIVYEARYDELDSLVSRYVRHADADTTWLYTLNKVIVNKRDQHGRDTLSAYYHLDMTPDEEMVFQRFVTHYDESPKHCTITEMYLTSDGKLVDLSVAENNTLAYERKVTEIDSVSRSLVVRYYANHQLSTAYGLEMDKSFTASTAILSYDKMGRRACSHASRSFYYTARIERDKRGRRMALSAFNEQGAPAYIMLGDYPQAPVYHRDLTWERNYRDEEEKAISDYEEFKNQHAAAYYIEVYDSTAYQWGLQSGDLIVQYGQWNYPKALTGRWHVDNQLAVQTVVHARQPKSVLVLRRGKKKADSRIITVQLPEGSPAELGFMWHKIYLTSAEREHYDDMVSQYLAQHTGQLANASAPFDLSTLCCLMKPYKMCAKEMNLYQLGVTEQSVVTNVIIYQNGKAAIFSTGDSLQVLIDMMNHDRDSMVVCYTTDGTAVKRLTLTPEMKGNRQNAISYSLDGRTVHTQMLSSKTVTPDADLSFDTTPQPLYQQVKHLSDSVSADFKLTADTLVALTTLLKPQPLLSQLRRGLMQYLHKQGELSDGKGTYEVFRLDNDWTTSYFDLCQLSAITAHIDTSRFQQVVHEGENLECRKLKSHKLKEYFFVEKASAGTLVYYIRGKEIQQSDVDEVRSMAKLPGEYFERKSGLRQKRQ